MAKIKELKRKASVIKESTDKTVDIVKVPLKEVESDSENVSYNFWGYVFS